MTKTRGSAREKGSRCRPVWEVAMSYSIRMRRNVSASQRGGFPKTDIKQMMAVKISLLCVQNDDVFVRLIRQSRSSRFSIDMLNLP